MSIRQPQHNVAGNRLWKSKIRARGRLTFNESLIPGWVVLALPGGGIYPTIVPATLELIDASGATSRVELLVSAATTTAPSTPATSAVATTSTTTSAASTTFSTAAAKRSAI